MSHDKFFGICENKCLVEINADSVGAANKDLSNIDNAVFAEKATEAGVGGGGGIVSEVVPIEKGGTGATTAEEARTNLGVASSDLSNVDSTVFLEKATSAGVGGGSGTVLFSSESGTTDATITLSDDISNYKYVEIYYESVNHTHIPDAERPEYYNDSKGNPTYPSEGLPMAPHPLQEYGFSNGYTEDTFQCCTGVKKTNIMPTSGVSHFLLTAMFIETQNQVNDGHYAEYKDLYTYWKRYELQLTAHLIGNSLSYDSCYFRYYDMYSWTATYGYSSNDGWIYKVNSVTGSHSGTSHYTEGPVFFHHSIKYPKVYTIIGYK